MRTPFVETEALLAVLDGDEDSAREILDDMLPNERRTFRAALDRLANLAYWYCPGCNQRLDINGSVSGFLEDKSWHQACRDAARAAGEPR